MSDKLPILLSAQIASEGLMVKCIAPIHVAESGGVTDYAKLLVSVEEHLHIQTRKLGGNVLIDPQFHAPVAWHNQKVAASASCIAGKIVDHEPEGSSE